MGDELAVNTYTTGDQVRPSVGRDPGGAFVVVWASAVQDAGTPGIFAQRFTAAGASVIGVSGDGIERLR